MRPRKEIETELKKIEKLTHQGQSIGYFHFLQGACVALMWALGINGRWKKTRKFLSPTSSFRKKVFDE